MRTFDSGATRDTVEDKLSYVKALDPAVLTRYVEYLGKHRTMPDGSTRDWDNWKKGIPPETCLDSEGRHFLADWLMAEGYVATDNHGVVDEEDTLCAIMFNAMCRLRVLLQKRGYMRRSTTNPTRLLPAKAESLLHDTDRHILPVVTNRTCGECNAFYCCATDSRKNKAGDCFEPKESA